MYIVWNIIKYKALFTDGDGKYRLNIKKKLCMLVFLKFIGDYGCLILLMIQKPRWNLGQLFTRKTKNKTYSLSIYTLTFVDSKLMSGLFTSWAVSECVSYIWMLLFDAI